LLSKRFNQPSNNRLDDAFADQVIKIPRSTYADFGPTLATEKLRTKQVAALSMLQDDPAHAPYGWTHCFTLPHSILSLTDVVSDTVRAVRIAATHALGFRATLGRTRLVYPYAPEPRLASSLLDLEPADVAAVAYHAVGDHGRSLRTQLIECAAVHADAHLVTYTMACLTIDPIVNS
jgi:hypothetical protein